jgi:Ca2+-binding RTX toxin-like protein
VLDAHGAALNYSEDQSAAAIAPSITVMDADNLHLTGAKVQITGGFAASEDVLGFVDQNGITGSYNSATGLLTLTGLATVAFYEAALASVTYSNTAALSTATRTIGFTVDDGQADNHASNTVTVDVTVAAVDDTLNVSASAWAASGAIDLGGGVNVLNVAADGTDISAAGTPSLAHVDTGNLIGTGGTDSITLTGLQLDNIIVGSGTIDLGAGSGDTINLKSTSADLNTLGATDGSIVGVEAISAAGAGAGVSIDVHGQSEGFTITGSANADTLIGGSGNDTINGGNGADIIIGGAGADNLTGGLGADVFHISSVDGDTINGTGESGTLDVLMLDAIGTYDLRGPGSASLPPTPDTISNIDVISFNVDAAGFSLNVGGSGGGMVATADANGDGILGDLQIGAAVAMTHGVTISSSALSGNQGIHVDGTNLGGNDTITGNGGIDVIDGGAGNDTIDGKLGNDTIIGGAGNDTLTGGGGADTFVFQANFGMDTITDFAAGTDFLQFDHTVFADVAAVLAATSDVSGHAVIAYDANNTVTLNIDTATLTLHQSDIHIV